MTNTVFFNNKQENYKCDAYKVNYFDLENFLMYFKHSSEF